MDRHGPRVPLRTFDPASRLRRALEGAGHAPRPCDRACRGPCVRHYVSVTAPGSNHLHRWRTQSVGPSAWACPSLRVRGRRTGWLREAS